MEIKATISKTNISNYFVLLDELKVNKNLEQHLPNNIAKELKNIDKNQIDLKHGQITQIINSNLSHQKQRVFIVSYISKHNTKDKLRLLGYNIAKSIHQTKLTKINIVTDSNFNNTQIAEIYYGIQQGNYKFRTFLTSKKADKKIETINFINSLDSKILKNSLHEIEVLIQSINIVKDLVNTPAMSLTPLELANQSLIIAKKSSKIKIKILKEKDLIKEKLNLIYSVGLGSSQESRLIIMEYRNGPKKQKPTLLVGKGVTFDAGGLHLKPTASIDNMKMDMAGAATVLGFFNILSKLNLPINIIGIIPTVENLLGHNAYKPGDILTSYSGKTIEITNTDAEGRLILADAISYGIDKYAPSCIIDIATLTGACIAALGNTHTALISNDKKLIKQMWKASKLSADKAWPLPLDQYHRDKVKGTISDYINWTAGVNAGAIMGGAFIEKFVQKIPWIHLDIAGSSYYDNPIGYRDKGATGQPLNMIYQFFKND